VGYGYSKLDQKGLDAIVVNDISRPDIGFDVDCNEVVILDRAGHHGARGPKTEVAEAVLDEVQRLRERQSDGGSGTHRRSVAGV
jgi:phosphopantothenoylcysteine decarboxylase/phosphopantothenate--cysteine ligase